MFAPRIGPVLLAVLASSLPAIAQEAEQPGPPHETALEVGEAPPVSFALPSIDGDVHDLSAVTDRPMLLLFFRGTW